MEQENSTPSISTQIAQNISGRGIARNRSIIPLGYVLVFLLFAFSFCDFKCNVERVGSVTGYDLVIGKYVKANPLFKNTDEAELKKLIKPIYKTYEDDDGREMKAIQVPANTWAIIALVTAFLGLVAFMFTYTAKPYVAIVSGVAGGFSMLMVHSTLSRFVNDRFSYMLSASFTPAFWLTFACFAVVAIAGYYKLKYPVLAGVADAPPEGEEYKPVPPPSMEDFISNNKWALLATAFFLVSGTIFYKAYIQKDYTDELKALAVEACNCDKDRYDTEKKKFSELLTRISKAKRGDWEDLNREFGKMERKIDKDHEKCTKYIHDKFNIISEKAKGSDDFATVDDVEEKFKEYIESTRDSLYSDLEDENEWEEKVENALDSLKYSYPRDTSANPLLDYLYNND